MLTLDLSPPAWWLAAGSVAAVIDACLLLVVLWRGFAG